MRQATDEDDIRPPRGGNFQQGVMNKKLKEQESNLLAKIQEHGEKQQQQFDRITKLIQQNQNNSTSQHSHNRDRSSSSRNRDKRSRRSNRSN
jgi:hypothetical protein